ncbi:hypothetical protein KI387_037784, partial [Taxus chinensis]
IRLGHLGHEDAKDAKDANRAEIKGSPFQAVQKEFVPDSLRTVGTNGCEGREKPKGAESQWKCATCLHLKEGQGSPNRADRRNLSQTVWDIRARSTRWTWGAERAIDESERATCLRGSERRRKG